MLRSMYAGISGMKGFQTKLDVVGNNIANVNTAGFKKGRTTFQDMMSQSINGASAPTDQRGGINPQQVGTGSQTGSIDNLHTQGNRQTTERPLDLQLEGDGMFVFGTGLTDTDGNTGEDFDATSGLDLEDTNIEYSRAGNMYLDDEGYIVNANGQYLIGKTDVAAETDGSGNRVDDPSAVDGTGDFESGSDGVTDNIYGRIQIPDNAESFSIQGNGTVNYVQNGETMQAGQIMLSKFSNSGGLNKVGSNMFQDSVNAGQMEQVTGEVDVDGDDGFDDQDITTLFAPENEGTASIVSGALEMSNVDLSEEFTSMITAQRGFQANTRIITTSDEILQELVNLKR
ncbi:flagellar hook protein [Gracilibacillus halophilus YIM-C55.5]|uniref:Flagellar hook protein FlgE n=1 Tax=Gracilibacillus halophilus YIM-C55.5 TaxID=1308866 RepID=N4WD64_9BACI|nr:flagellar hook-basal body complex protein [Gracilibacillus halophilus]ENH98233.1 flagellar hook protein [Gracilibacillus halophilus YIM-C55.5]